MFYMDSFNLFNVDDKITDERLGVWRETKNMSDDRDKTSIFRYVLKISKKMLCWMFSLDFSTTFICSQN